VDATTDLGDAPNAEAQPKHRKSFIREGTIPAGSLTWKGRRHFKSRMIEWRQAIWAEFPTEARVLKVAWCLEGLFEGRGYAFASNPYLAAQTAIPINKVEQALKALSDAGAIVRAHVFTKRGLQRRLFPAAKILLVLPPKTGGAAISDLPPKTGGDAVNVPTPQDGTNSPPAAGGQKKKELRGQFSSTQTAALRDAERRAAREANRGSEDEFWKPSAPR
jgi:hypothetical protein